MVVTENVFAVTKTRIICLVGLKLVPIFWKFSIFYFLKIVHHAHVDCYISPVRCTFSIATYFENSQVGIYVSVSVLQTP